MHVLGVSGLRRGQSLRAIRLFAASASQLAVIKMERFADAEAEIALARSLSRAPEHDEAWTQGRGMSLDAVKEYALEGLPCAGDRLEGAGIHDRAE